MKIGLRIVSIFVFVSICFIGLSWIYHSIKTRRSVELLSTQQALLEKDYKSLISGFEDACRGAKYEELYGLVDDAPKELVQSLADYREIYSAMWGFDSHHGIDSLKNGGDESWMRSPHSKGRDEFHSVVNGSTPLGRSIVYQGYIPGADMAYYKITFIIGRLPAYYQPNK